MATVLKASFKDLQQSTKPLSRVINFLKKYPPSQYSAMATGQVIPTSKQRVVMDAKPLSSTNVPQASSIPPAQTMALEDGSEDELAQTQYTGSGRESSSFPPNPFLPYKNPETGRWRGARIGLRQQADLFNAARECGLEDCLPSSIKSSTYKQQRLLERGLAIRGTGEGQHVKGHKWERTMANTLAKRRKAMEDMPQLIREWEQRGHGRGWKKYPR